MINEKDEYFCTFPNANDDGVRVRLDRKKHRMYDVPDAPHGATLFAHRAFTYYNGNAMMRSGWVVTERMTGYRVCVSSSPTRAEAISEAVRRLEDITKRYYDATVALQRAFTDEYSLVDYPKSKKEDKS